MIRPWKHALATIVALVTLWACASSTCHAVTFAFKNLAFISGTVSGDSFTTDPLTGLHMPTNMLMVFQVAQYSTSANVKLYRFNYGDGAGTALSSGSGTLVSLVAGKAVTVKYQVAYKAATDIATVTANYQNGKWTINLVVSSEAGVPYFSRQGTLNSGYAVTF